MANFNYTTHSIPADRGWFPEVHVSRKGGWERIRATQVQTCSLQAGDGGARLAAGPGLRILNKRFALAGHYLFVPGNVVV